MTLHVYFPTRPMPNTLDELRPLVPPSVVLSAGPETPQPVETDILVTGAVTAEQLARSPGLRAVIVPYAGVPFETQALLRDQPTVELHNLHFNVVSTAEMALALLLAASKHVPELDRRIRTGNWRWDDTTHPTDTLPGKTAVILGYGSIGRYLAPILQALGLSVIGVRRHASAGSVETAGATDPGGATEPTGATGPTGPNARAVQVVSVAHLRDVLPQADVLISLLPHTRETEGLMSAELLALLPGHCILVNVGRGAVFEEEALYTLLRERRIRAAGIDVWYVYPKNDEERTHTFPSRYPFHELDNVVMTPHRAGWLQSFEKLRVQALAELLLAADAGRPMPNRVDKQLGY